MSGNLELFQKKLTINTQDYWSMFYLSGETSVTAQEWARSQLIEVYEALFWIAYDKPKKKLNLDKYVIKEWLVRMSDDREYYEAKDDLLLLLSFGLNWGAKRICNALGVCISAYYHRLFEAIRVKSSKINVSSNHLSPECAQIDLRSPEYFLGLKFSPGLHLVSENEFLNHIKKCKRCSQLVKDAEQLKKMIQKDWVQPVPLEVNDELFAPFAEAIKNPVKKNIWSKTPPILRWLIAAMILSALIYFSFYYQGWQL